MKPIKFKKVVKLNWDDAGSNMEVKTMSFILITLHYLMLVFSKCADKIYSIFPLIILCAILIIYLICVRATAKVYWVKIK